MNDHEKQVRVHMYGSSAGARLGQMRHYQCVESQARNFARQQMDEARRAAEAKDRNVKLLQECHKRIAGSPVVWGDRDLLQRISEEVMEAQR